MIRNLIIYIHGVETADSITGYAAPLAEGIDGVLPVEERGRFSHVFYDWNKELQPRELKVYESCETGLHFPDLRKKKMLIAADVICSSRSKSGNGFLEKCFREIDEIVALHKARYSGDEIRVHVIGHSQGGQNGLEYCWDAAHPVWTLIMMGAPIDLKSPMYDGYGMAPPVKAWHNFYSSYDTISSKLENHPSDSIRSKVQDHEVTASIFSPVRWGGLINRLGDGLGYVGFIYKTLVAHTAYWKSEQVHKEIAQILLEQGS